MAERDITRWAENAIPENLADPGLAQELAGYSQDQTLPHDEFNYIIRQIAKRRVFTLHEAVAQLDIGAVAFVDETSATERMSTIGSESVAGKTGSAVDGDGEFFFVGFSDGEVRKYDRDGVYQTVTTTPAAGVVQAISADGAFVFVVIGNLVYKRNRTDLTAAAGWTNFDHTVAVHDVYSTGEEVLICGAPNQSNNQLRALNYTTGAATSSGQVIEAAQYPTCYGLCSDGENVYVAHDQTAISDFILTHFGDLGFVNIEGQFANANNDGRCVDCGRDFVVLGVRASGGDKTLYCLTKFFHDADFTGLIWEREIGSDLDVFDVSVSEPYVAVAHELETASAANRNVAVYELASGSLVYANLGTSAQDAKGIYLDGFRVCIADETSIDVTVKRLQRAAWVKRVDPNDRNRMPQHQLAVTIT